MIKQKLKIVYNAKVKLKIVFRDCKKTFPMTAEHFSRPSHFVQKFLFSATLTQNPEKIAPLELYNPLLFTTQSSTDEDKEDKSK